MLIGNCDNSSSFADDRRLSFRVGMDEQLADFYPLLEGNVHYGENEEYDGYLFVKLIKRNLILSERMDAVFGRRSAQSA